MEYTCQCCGISKEFADGEEAFDAGWDCPPHFTGYISCDLCPAAGIVLHIPHAKAHAYWAEHGRPAEFNKFCALDDEVADQGAFEKATETGRRIAQQVIEAAKKREKTN